MILNAVDALVEGGYIEIKSLMKDHGAVITISDNGVGMSDGTLSRVFFPFFTTKGQQSTGMGLAVVYGIIARHKGEIDVTSKIGKGTTFCLTFKTMEKVDSKVETLTEVKEIRKVRALVIDDDENILDVMGDILKFLGHEVTLASSGEEGVELFKEGEFEIVITDLGMPGISGWEVTRICKSLKPDIPVVMISGWGNQIDDEMVKQSQLNGIMSKPFEMNKIKSMILNTLAQKHQKQQNIVSESKK
jgi:CheY-like chemotaxis protein